MKKAILSFCILFLLSCGNSNLEFQHQKSDTAITAIEYMNPQTFSGFSIVALRIIKDTLIYDSVDNNTLRKNWKRDTTYQLPVYAPVLDSLKRQMKDSSGNPMNYLKGWGAFDQGLVLYDYNKKY